MRLYVGEVRTDEYDDISEYKVCRKFEDAIDWCMENTLRCKERQDILWRQVEMQTLVLLQWLLLD